MGRKSKDEEMWSKVNKQDVWKKWEQEDSNPSRISRSSRKKVKK